MMRFGQQVHVVQIVEEEVKISASKRHDLSSNWLPNIAVKRDCLTAAPYFFTLTKCLLVIPRESGSLKCLTNYKSSGASR